MQFPAGARDLFSYPKPPHQLGGWATLDFHVLLTIRVLATTPWLPHYDFIVCNLMNTGAVLPSRVLFSSTHLKILNHTTENKFQRLGLFCSFPGKRQGHDVLAPWGEEAVRYQQRQHNHRCNSSQQQGLYQQHTASHLHYDRSCSSLFGVFLNTSGGQQ